MTTTEHEALLLKIENLCDEAAENNDLRTFNLCIEAMLANDLKNAAAFDRCCKAIGVTS